MVDPSRPLVSIPYRKFNNALILGALIGAVVEVSIPYRKFNNHHPQKRFPRKGGSVSIPYRKFNNKNESINISFTAMKFPSLIGSSITR